MRQGNHRVSRWLFGHNARPPRLVRLAFFGVGLVVLGATYAATDSEGLQLLALFVLIFGVLPALDRRFGAVDDYTKAVQERNVPFSVVALSLALGIAWAALVLIVVPELGLGPAFWLWVVMWPWIEVVAFLGERRLRRDGGAHTWQPARPLRDSAFAGLATAPCIFAITLLQDFDVREAVATAIACAVCVFGVSGMLAWLMRRGQATGGKPRRLS